MEIIRPLSIGTTTNSTNILVSFYRVRTIIGLVEPNSYTNRIPPTGRIFERSFVTK